MTIEQQAEELTKAYLVSYNLAMGQVRNPEFAAQIAGMIVVAINGTLPKQQNREKKGQRRKRCLPLRCVMRKSGSSAKTAGKTAQKAFRR